MVNSNPSIQHKKYKKKLLGVREGKRVRVRLHRWVMEQHLGRKLLSHEVVHHINENIHDNRLENLELTNLSDHMKHHHTGDISPSWRGDLRTDEIVTLFQQGKSLREIGRLLGAPHITIRRRLKRVGIWHSQR